MAIDLGTGSRTCLMPGPVYSWEASPAGNMVAILQYNDRLVLWTVGSSCHLLAQQQSSFTVFRIG